MRTIRLLPVILLSAAACSGNKATPDAHIIVSDSTTQIDAPGLNLVDSYMDRDTFQFATGATTNQLSVRLNWPGATSDMDFYLFPVNKTDSFASSTSIGNSEDEFTTFAVKPSTNYWLWVGQYAPMGAPAAITYDASVCGETFTPSNLVCGANSSTVFNEANDAGNDYNATPAGVAEPTAITATTFSVCGNINSGHYAAAQMRVDIDSFQFMTAAASDVIATFQAPGAGALDDVEFFLYDITNNATLVAGRFVNDHAIGFGNLPAGNYEVDMEAHSGAAITASIPYRVNVTVDTPATRCVKATAATNYTEAADGADNKGNDMIQVDYNAVSPALPIVLTTSTTDMAEPTGLTIAPATTYRITGNSAIPQ